MHSQANLQMIVSFEVISMASNKEKRSVWWPNSFPFCLPGDGAVRPQPCQGCQVWETCQSSQGRKRGAFARTSCYFDSLSVSRYQLIAPVKSFCAVDVVKPKSQWARLT